jgi:hypothetical protein
MKNQKKNIYMAFGQVTELNESAVAYKRYIGYTNVSIIGINPNKAEWEKLYGLTRDSEITYLGKNNVNGVETDQLRIDFIIKTDPEKSGGVEIVDRISYFIANSPNYNRDQTKIEMVDAYGEFQYLPVEDAKAGRIPIEVTNFGRFKGTDMRPAFVGEKSLTQFLRAYLGVPERPIWNSDESNWSKEISDPNKALMRLDNISSYFRSGDISEIKNLPNNNKVRVVFGVKKTDDGKLYSDIYSRKVLKLDAADRNWISVEKDIKSAKEAGAYPNTTFVVEPFKEYIPEISEPEKPIWNEQPAVSPAFGGGVSKFFNK